MNSTTSTIYGNAVLITAFLGAVAKAAETWTEVLAVSVARGRRATLAGLVAVSALLALIVAWLVSQISILAPFEQRFVLGVLLLLLGMRWLRKAILRYVGVIPPRGEKAVYQQSRRAWQGAEKPEESGFDWFGFLTSFKIIFMSGLQVICIALALGYTGQVAGPAGAGAALGGSLVLIAGLLLRRPLTEIPCNRLRFSVGTLLSAFGTFWTADALGLPWPPTPAVLLVLAMTFWAAGWAAIFRGDSDKRYKPVVPINTSIP